MLETLKNKLLYEVNPRKEKFPKCPKYYREKTPWKVGDLLACWIVKEPRGWGGWNPKDRVRMEAAEEKVYMRI